MATFVLPLVLIPYLARVLHPAAWGLVIFAQSFGLWIWLILEYGFNFSATREVARHRGDTQRISTIVSGVMGAKAVLAVAAMLVTLLTMIVAWVLIAKFCSPQNHECCVVIFRAHPDYLCWAVIYSLTQGMSPLWYFQGTERMVSRALLDILSRVVVTVATVLVVKSASQGWIVLAMQGVGGLISTTLLLTWMYREIQWRLPTWREIDTALRQGWSMFVFRMASSLYTIANSFILGLFVPTIFVGYYGAADRAVNAAKGLIDPMSQAFYPRISHMTVTNPAKAVRLAWYALFIIGLIGIALGGGLALAAPQLVHIMLGRGYDAVVPVLRVLALSLPVIAFGTVLGVQWVLPLGLDRQFATVVIGAGVLNLILACLLAPHWKAVGMAWPYSFPNWRWSSACYGCCWPGPIRISMAARRRPCHCRRLPASLTRRWRWMMSALTIFSRDLYV